MRHTISVLVENHAGVLSRISGLFSRRGFNIDSLAVGETDEASVSRITIVATGDDHMVEQLEKQLSKLIEVIKVRRLVGDELISRELLLIKINAPADKRAELMSIVEITGARIIDITTATITIELSDRAEKLATLEALVAPYGIREIVRTGTIAIQRGEKGINN